MAVRYLKCISAGEPVLDCNCYGDKWFGGLGVSAVSVLAVASPSPIRASGVVICATRTGGLSLSQQRPVSFYCTSDSNQGEKKIKNKSNFHALLPAHHHKEVGWCQRCAETPPPTHPLNKAESSTGHDIINNKGWYTALIYPVCFAWWA